MKKLVDFYNENPKAYGEMVAKANAEHKKMVVIDNKLVLVDSEPIVLDYKAKRAKNYPKIKDQLDMIWHAIDEGKLDKSSDFYLMLKEIKDAYPKV